jgi:hypothetical protein
MRMQRRVGSRALGVVVCAAGLLLGACGSETPGTTAARETPAEPAGRPAEGLEKAGEVTLERDGADVRVETDDGRMEGRFGPGAALPDDFPEDVPLPPDVRVMGAMTSREAGAEGSIVSLRSDGPAADLLDAFRSGIGRNGWIVEEESTAMGWQVIRASKQGRTLTVQAMDRDDGSAAMLHLAR